MFARLGCNPSLGNSTLSLISIGIRTAKLHGGSATGLLQETHAASDVIHQPIISSVSDPFLIQISDSDVLFTNIRLSTSYPMCRFESCAVAALPVGDHNAMLQPRRSKWETNAVENYMVLSSTSFPTRKRRGTIPSLSDLRKYTGTAIESMFTQDRGATSWNLARKTVARITKPLIRIFFWYGGLALMLRSALSFAK
jgi:hypothetical protein